MELVSEPTIYAKKSSKNPTKKKQSLKNQKNLG
jgi:hypothetical protein